MVTRRKNVAWDSDRAHSEGQTSLEVLLAWLADSFNYARWKGGVVTKEDLCSEINNTLRSERIHHRKNLDIRVKLMKLEKTFAAANQWLIDTGLHDSVMRGECSSDVKNNLNKLCRYYDILAPGMLEAMMATNSEPKGPHIVPAVSSPLKEKAAKKAPVVKAAVTTKPVAKPAVKTDPAKTTESDASDEESSDSSEEQNQKNSKEKTSVVLDVPATKPDTVNESSDSDDDSSSSAGEEVDIPAAQEAPAGTSDTSSDEEEESEKEEEEKAKKVVVLSAEDEEDESEEDTDDKDDGEEEPVKTASPNGMTNGKLQHGVEAQAVKLVTPLVASQRIVVSKASPAPKHSESKNTLPTESTQDSPTRAVASKDPMQATSLRQLRVLHRLDIEDRREKRKRQRTLYELEHQKLQVELETKQLQRDQERLDLEVARALARQKLLAAGISQQQTDRTLAK